MSRPCGGSILLVPNLKVEEKSHFSGLALVLRRLKFIPL